MAIAGSSPQQQAVANSLLTKMFEVMRETQTIGIRNWTAEHAPDSETVQVTMEVVYNVPAEEFNGYVTEAYGSSQ